MLLKLSLVDWGTRNGSVTDIEKTTATSPKKDDVVGDVIRMHIEENLVQVKMNSVMQSCADLPEHARGQQRHATASNRPARENPRHCCPVSGTNGQPETPPHQQPPESPND